MTLEGLSFVKTLLIFGIIYMYNRPTSSKYDYDCLPPLLTFDSFRPIDHAELCAPVQFFKIRAVFYMLYI